jgi:non-heme chloroperoxidase
VSQGTIDAFWLQIERVKAFSETDFTKDLAKIDVPTLVVHGDDDQVVPLAVGGARSSKMIAGAKLEVYAGRPHALGATDADRLNDDILAFARASAERRAAPEAGARA